MNPAKIVCSHWRKIQVGDDEVHFHAGGPTHGVAMTIEYTAQRSEIFGAFETVEIVGPLTKVQSRGPKLFQSPLIAEPDPSPIVALKHNERAVKVEALDREKIHASLPDFAGIV